MLLPFPRIAVETNDSYTVGLMHLLWYRQLFHQRMILDHNGVKGGAG